MGISPRSRCSARSSSALIAYSPFAEILIGAASPPAEPALEQAGRLPREVGGDHVGAGVRVRHRGAREQLEGRIVAHRAVFDYAAVAVARVLAEADVGDDEQVRHRVLHGAYGLLHDAVIGVGLGATRILLRGNTEEQHAGDAHAGGILALLDQLIHGEAVLAGHRRDRLAHAAAVHDEQGVDEVVDRQRRLADELAEQRLFAQAARAEHAVGHHSLLLPRVPGRFGIRANHSPLARARAGLVYSPGMMSVARPCSPADAATHVTL